MKKALIPILLAMLLFVGCRSPDPVNTLSTGPPDATTIPATTETATTPSIEESVPEDSLPEDTVPFVTEPQVPPEETDPVTPEATVPRETAPVTTTPKETDPPSVSTPAPPVETAPVETAPEEVGETTETTPMGSEPEETAPAETEPEETVTPITSPTEEFKQQVAYYAAYYINQYRVAEKVPACTILPGMTKVAEYRADQLTYNYSHSTADKRAALAYYEYGRWIDATIVGLDPSESYYEADTTEAICAGFEGKDAESMGKYIADLVRNSSNHWSYVGNANNLYIGVGVEYRVGSTYGWYGCIMVGKTNYG